MDKTLWRRDIAKLFAALLLFFSIGLGARAYITPSEARYIELPRQMLATGDWLTPRINGVPYFEKPPLFYWMQASVMQFGGLGEFSGRLATMLVVIATCLTTFSIAGLIYGRTTAWLSATVLSTCLLGYGLSREAMLDAPVTLFITLCIGCFIAAQKDKNPQSQKCRYWGMYIASALAVLTKGLIGIVIPGLVIGAWIAINRRWKLLLEVRLISGLVLFALIAVPWHYLMAREHPEFLNFYFIHEHFTRYLTDEHKRTAPWWFFIAVTIAGLLPWVVLLPRTIKACYRERKEGVTMFLSLWVVLPMLFFSSSHSKLIPYIFPIFPPLAILIGHQLSLLWTNEKSRSRIITTAIVMVVIEITANYIAPRFDKRTIRPLTDILKQDLKPQDEVVAYSSYWQDLPVYLQRNVTVAGWTGELTFGVEHYPITQNWMIDAKAFPAFCAKAKGNVYAFVPLQKKAADYDAAAALSSPHCVMRIMSTYGNTALLKKEKHQ